MSLFGRRRLPARAESGGPCPAWARDYLVFGDWRTLPERGTDAWKAYVNARFFSRPGDAAKDEWAALSASLWHAHRVELLAAAKTAGVVAHGTHYDQA